MQNYLKPNWPAPANIRAYTTLRHGGYSQGPYTSFNLADHVGDNPQAVRQNREKMKSDLQLPKEPVWLTQTHSTKVLCLDGSDVKQKQEADASYTSKPREICAVLTADCVPILIAAKDGSLVAAIHAGWKGLAAGIIEATLEKIATDGTKLLAWLGPAIGPINFLVKNDVRQAFLEKEAAAELAFHKINNEQWRADAYLLAKQRLARYNVTEVYGGEFCTYRDEEKFFSYRRDQEITGRMATLIWIKN
jgi:polyphenol oxidase